MEDFQTKVLTRLAVIESKIDDVTNIRNKTDEAYHLSKENAEKITELREKNKWLSRAIIGAIVTAVVGLVFIVIKNGLGVK